MPGFRQRMLIRPATSRVLGAGGAFFSDLLGMKSLSPPPAASWAAIQAVELLLGLDDDLGLHRRMAPAAELGADQGVLALDVGSDAHDVVDVGRVALGDGHEVALDAPLGTQNE